MGFRRFLMIFALFGALFIHSSIAFSQAESGFNVGAGYSSPGEFDSISLGNQWCRGWMDRFDVGYDRFDEVCYTWRSSGRYGYYKYRSEFNYISRNYPGNPRFYLIPYGDGSGYDDRGGGY